MSCCGRGGSWFQSCGGDGSVRLRHTWYEGIQACKAQGRVSIVLGHRQQEGIGSFHGAGKVKSEGAMMAAKLRTFPSENMSTPMKGITPNAVHNDALVSMSTTARAMKKGGVGITTTMINTSTHTSQVNSKKKSRSRPAIKPGDVSTQTPRIPSAAARGCKNMLNVAFHVVSLLVSVVFRH